MRKGLTRKQQIFVDTYVETGVGAVAAREAYDIPEENKQLAAVIASENLSKPYIEKEVEKKLKDRQKLVEEAHNSLLTAVRLDYFVFPKLMKDEEIVEHVEAQGLTCLNIRASDKGKLAFFTLPDGASRAKGIEIHHKVEGTFAAEKHLNVNVEVEAGDEIKDLTKKLNELHRGTSISSNGGTSGTVGTETQDKE